MIKGSFFGWFLLLSSVAMAKENVRIRLTPLMTYRDVSVNCSTQNNPLRRYLEIVVDGGKVRSAAIQRDLPPLAFNPFWLNASELNDLRLLKNADGEWRLTRWKLSARLLGWFFYQGGSYLSCGPAQPLLTVSPGEFEFLFPEDTGWTYSNLGKFTGTRKDGGAYHIELEFLHETTIPFL